MSTEVKERGILLNQEMVLAVLDGNKTQTRRPVTVPWANGKRCRPCEPYYVESDGKLLAMDEYGDYHPVENTTLSPYGKVGDRLYVRETFIDGYHLDDFGVPDTTDDDGKDIDPHVWYRADKNIDFVWTDEDGGMMDDIPWKPSIHMPKKYARIWLEITGVRVERVRDITRTDIRAEGLVCPTEFCDDDLEYNYKDWYADNWKLLWQSCYPGSWERNDWVWVYDFKPSAR